MKNHKEELSMKIRSSKHILHKVLIAVMLMGAIAMLFGCGKQKYKLNLGDSGFESKRTEYAAGEQVTVYFDQIATDTNYSFYSDDVKLEQSYDDKHGCVFTFTMPAHDVTLYVQAHNSMEYIPYLNVTIMSEMPEADLWLLPNTEANRKTMLWGTATFANLEPSTTYDIELISLEDADAWLIRMIDVDNVYYEFNDIQLEDGCELHLYQDANYFDMIYLDVKYANGKDPITYTGFRASL